MADSNDSSESISDGKEQVYGSSYEQNEGASPATAPDYYERSQGGWFRGRSRFAAKATMAVLLVGTVIAILVAVLVSGGNKSNRGTTTSQSSLGNAEPNNSVPTASPAGSSTTTTTAAPVSISSTTTAAPVRAPTSTTTTTPAPSKAPVTTTTTAAPAQSSELVEFIKSKMADGGLSLLTSDSYQSKAMQFVQSTYISGEHDSQRVLQRFALACIYHATNMVENAYTKEELGENGVTFGWNKADGWLVEANECTWHGISCNSQGYVEEIDLAQNKLTGSFPPDTVMMKSSLVRLILLGNLYLYNYGDSGINWLGELENLKELDISETAFHYFGIPPAIGNLLQLEVLDVSYSLLYGSLQYVVFQSLDNLEYLDIGGNQYDTPLPPSIGELPKLQYFYAAECALTGDLSIWTTPDQTPELLELWIDKNYEISGSIPPEIGQYSNLVSLSLSELGIDGAIPTELGDLSQMKRMWLFGNSLNGNIPPHLANMTQLTRLEVEKNDLVGDMPEEICAKVSPYGLIEVLEADCDESNPEVSCAYPTCCTCCGEQCAVENFAPEAESLKTEHSGSLRKLAASTMKPLTAEDRIRNRQQLRHEKLLKRKDPVHAKAATEARQKGLDFHAKQMAFLQSQNQN
ncbi:hypothetical protein ACA910_007828 [Epithemia clementina (nom. ined.)]